MTENSLGYSKRLLEFAGILLNFTLENNEDSPFSNTSYQYTDSISGKEETKTEYLPGYAVIKNWSELFIRIKDSIYTAIDLVYNYYPNDIKISEGAFNMLINACNNSKIYEYCNDSDELFEFKEFSQLAEGLYELQVELNQSRWINKLQPHISRVTNVIQDYNKFFESHKKELQTEEIESNTNNSNSQNLKDCPLGYKFWLASHKDKDTGKVYSIEDFTESLNTHLSIFNTMLNDFNTLNETIQSLIKTYLDACNETGFMENLMSIIDKNTNIASILNKLQGVGFEPYSHKLGVFYDKFQASKSIWNTSKYSVSDRNHTNLRRITNSEVYKNIDFHTTGNNRNFFAQTRNWLVWINNFRERWSL